MFLASSFGETYHIKYKNNTTATADMMPATTPIDFLLLVVVDNMSIYSVNYLISGDKFQF